MGAAAGRGSRAIVPAKHSPGVAASGSNFRFPNFRVTSLSCGHVLVREER